MLKLPWLPRLFTRLLPPADRDQITADLAELYDERRRRGRLRAWCWLAAHTLRIAWAFRMGADPDERHAFLGDLRLDIRDAWRHLSRAPAFAVSTICALAFGIGAALGVYAIVHAALFAPLPYPDDRSIVLVGERSGDRTVSVSYLNFIDWRERARSFDAIAAYQADMGTLVTAEGALALRSYRVTADFFQVLGVRAALGRVLGAVDAQPDAPAVAVLSHQRWTTSFGGDPAVVGRSVTFDGVPYVVIGIMPPGFDFEYAADLWVPIDRFVPGSDLANRGSRAGTAVVARLAPGATVQGAQEEMRGVSTQLAREHPGPNGTILATVVGLRDARTGGSRAGLLALLGAVGALLLIGCLNATSLQTARVASRAREFAVRAAVGASRRRLARQLLIEGLVLALLSGLAGLAIAHGLIQATIALDPGGIPRLEEASIDLRAVPVALALSTVVGVLFGLLPLAATGHGVLSGILHEGGRSATTSRRWTRLRAGLVVVQIALSLALITGSALMVQTIVRLGRVDPGFDPDGLLAVTVQLTTTGTQQDGWRQTFTFFRDLTERVSALPGVSSAAVVTPLPLTGANRQNRYWVAGVQATTVSELPRIDTAVVSERYFDTMRIPVLSGRAFEQTDVGPRSVAVIDETFAARYFPGRDPIGQEVVMGLPGPNAPRLRVVGLVGAVHQYRLTQEPLPQIYLTQRQWPLGGWFLVRTNGDAAAIAPAVRAAIQEVDPSVPIRSTYPATDLVRESSASETFSAFVLTLFAALALGLAGLGLSGLMAHEVAARRREIGVRLALGATAGDVRRQVLVRALALVLSGSALGLGGAWLLARSLETLAFGVTAADPITYGMAVAVMVAAGLAGSLVPVLRASQVAPVEVLG